MILCEAAGLSHRSFGSKLLTMTRNPRTIKDPYIRSNSSFKTGARQTRAEEQNSDAQQWYKNICVWFWRKSNITTTTTTATVFVHTFLNARLCCLKTRKGNHISLRTAISHIPSALFFKRWSPFPANFTSLKQTYPFVTLWWSNCKPIFCKTCGDILEKNNTLFRCGRRRPEKLAVLKTLFSVPLWRTDRSRSNRLRTEQLWTAGGLECDAQIPCKWFINNLQSCGTGNDIWRKRACIKLLMEQGPQEFWSTRHFRQCITCFAATSFKVISPNSAIKLRPMHSVPWCHGTSYLGSTVRKKENSRPAFCRSTVGFVAFSCSLHRRTSQSADLLTLTGSEKWR